MAGRVRSGSRRGGGRGVSRKLLSLVLSLSMASSCVPVNAFAIVARGTSVQASAQDAVRSAFGGDAGLDGAAAVDADGNVVIGDASAGLPGSGSPGQADAAQGADPVAPSLPDASSQAQAQSQDPACAVVRKALSDSFVAADGRSWSVVLRYGDDAGIPDGACLDVRLSVPTPDDPDASPDAHERFIDPVLLAEQEAALGRTLSVGAADHMFFSSFLSLSVVCADGSVIDPKADVEVSIETDAVDASSSDAVEVASFTPRGAASLANATSAGVFATDLWRSWLGPRAEALPQLSAASLPGPSETDYYRVPAVRNATGDFAYDGEGHLMPASEGQLASVRFDTKDLSLIGVAGVVAPLATRAVDGTDVELLGPRHDFEFAVQDAEAPADTAGSDGAFVADAFSVQASLTDDAAARRAGEATRREREALSVVGLDPSLADGQGFDLSYGVTAWVRVRQGRTAPLALWASSDAARARRLAAAESGAADAFRVDRETLSLVRVPAASDGQQTPAGPDAGGAGDATSVPSFPGGDHAPPASDGQAASSVPGTSALPSTAPGALPSAPALPAAHSQDANPASDGLTLSEEVLSVAGVASGDVPAALVAASVLARNPFRAQGAPSRVRPIVTPASSRPDASSLSAQADATSTADGLLSSRLSALDGNWATWVVTVNPEGRRLAGGGVYTLVDAFSENQSIDYLSIGVTQGVSYDYRGHTGTFSVPDETPVTVTYRTRIKAPSAEQPVDYATFGHVATLVVPGEGVLCELEDTREQLVYPSPNDVASTTGTYMVRAFVYADGDMQEGLAGAQLVLLDANRRVMTYGAGEREGEPVIFVTGADGCADVALDAGRDGLAIEKNTVYHLEMIKAPDGYKKDSTLYNFMISDNPDYGSDGVQTYYNGDTMKMRLSPEAPGLSVSVRFSGNYGLTYQQKAGVQVVLQRRDNDTWVDVERHGYDEFSYGSISFENGSADLPLRAGETYRVVQEGARPWSIPASVTLSTTHYLVVAGSDHEASPAAHEFTVEESQLDKSFSVVIDNRYEEHELEIVKMDKATGDLLPGATFSVFKADGDVPTGLSYVTDDDGRVVLRGGESFESETLYYASETHAPEGYLLPQEPERMYFYFCNDPYLEPSVLDGLPDGETAVNLSETYDSVTVNNLPLKRSVPVMKTWQGSEWPDDVEDVVLGLYRSAGGGRDQAERVTDEFGQPLRVTLTRQAPFNGTAFSGLDTCDENGRAYDYYVREESVDAVGGGNVVGDYVQEYGVSDAGVLIVRNSEATSLTVTKEWYDGDGRVTDGQVLAAQPDVTFSLYRSTERVPDAVHEGGVTYGEMSGFVRDRGLVEVRSGVTFGAADGWSKEIGGLPRRDDLGNEYAYYVLEDVPSFGTELYELDEDAGSVVIRNQVLPETSRLVVTLGPLVDDPREGAQDAEFGFVLSLEKDGRPIRGYDVAVAGGAPLTTDADGHASFSLKPGRSTELSLPVGVTATVAEDQNPEYHVTASGQGAQDVTPTGDAAFGYVVAAGQPVTVSFTNTLLHVCKVVGRDGTEHPFESFRSALAFARAHMDEVRADDGTVTVWMIGDYVMSPTDSFDVREGEHVVLATAPVDAPVFPYVPGEGGGDTATVTRGTQSGSMLSNEGTLTLRDVMLDGAGAGVSADGAIVNSSGTLNVRDGAVLRGGRTSGRGGAVYSTGTVDMSGGSVTGNVATGGSALYLAAGTLRMSGGSVTGNVATADGAVATHDGDVRIVLSGAPVVRDNVNGAGEPSNVFVGVDSDNVIEVVSPGLSPDAWVGVRPMESHREVGEQFAVTEFEVTDNLSAFVNDLYDYRGSLKPGTSTNVVWDGLTLRIAKAFDGGGANPGDTFTLTLTSKSIRRSNYAVEGNLDHTIVPARSGLPGTITFRGVRAGDEIAVSPLPVGDYAISEAASDYEPSYACTPREGGGTVPVADDGSFSLRSDCTVVVTNERRLADVRLTKRLRDGLAAAGDTVDFGFSVRLVDADGTPVRGFRMADGVVTGDDGTASLTLAPSGSAAADVDLEAPVGATLTVTEQPDASYSVLTSARTMPRDGEPADIADADAEHDNVLSFRVTDDGAHVSFDNVRRMAEVELRKELVGKVRDTESFDMALTLTNADGSAVAGYAMCPGEGGRPGDVVTDEDGRATLSFGLAQGETSSSRTLRLPEGTRLTVEEAAVTADVGGEQKEIYETTHSLNGSAPARGRSIVVGSVADGDTIVFKNVRKTSRLTVKNTVEGYSGNRVPFDYTVVIASGEASGYNEGGFTAGRASFELATGQSKDLVVPYGERVEVEQGFVVGYETTLVHGGVSQGVADRVEFTADGDVTDSFVNAQLIGLRIVNKTPFPLEGLQVSVGDGKRIYRVDDDGDGQSQAGTGSASVDVAAGATAVLQVQHGTSATEEQPYVVSGAGPAQGYLYDVDNEPSFHEFADPAVVRVYDEEPFSVAGRLRYSVSDSTVTVSARPLVSFDPNGGVWTTEMEGYRARPQDVMQKAVIQGQRATRPDPDPVYPTAQEVPFLGWTDDEAFAALDHGGEGPADVADRLYDFSRPVTAPLTLYAVWAKDQGSRVVAVMNGTGGNLSCEVTLEDSTGAPVALRQLADGLSTDADGHVSLTLAAGAMRDLSVPDGARLVVTATPAAIAISSEFEDSDPDPGSFAVDRVSRDGTIAFTAGVCKITDAAGDVLYAADGRPAVFASLADAFSAYPTALYSDAAATHPAVAGAVKMLVDEHEVSSTLVFPGKDMVLTTAGRQDGSFPYVGSRTRSTLRRAAGFNGGSMFAHSSHATSVTVRDIVLDGGGVELAKNVNGGLVSMTKAGATLNVEDGAVMRNVRFARYDDGNGARGGAVYATNGTLNVRAGLFSDLHARRGGAICVRDAASLSVTGTDGSTRFEGCLSDLDDGGAIHYYSKARPLVIDGGSDKDAPGIVFVGCKATGNVGDGGALFAQTDYTNGVSVSGCSFSECSARNSTGGPTNGYGGGGVSAYKVTGLSVTACSFDECDTLCGGGGIAAFVKASFLDDPSVVVSDCSFDHCNSKAQGGAMAVYQDDNRALSSKTGLSVSGSSFNACSSGTNNGSGGAIQCYLPCLSFVDASFSDCWAGKEGGAVNNFFGANYPEVWENSSLTVTRCRFVRCRAEDRYDVKALPHYGGGINSKARVATVTDSYFEDCVSTLREGGALHLGGQGAGSSATVSGSTFKGCTAKVAGGALMASAAQVSVSGSRFYGCSSSAGNGGAICNTKNSRGDSTQESLTVTGCVFSADPDGGASAQGCAAASNGGAIWSRAASVTVSGCDMSSCSAAGNGGAVYLSKEKGAVSATLSGSASAGSVTGCRATKGAAVWAEDKVSVTFAGLAVTGNVCTDAGSGAVAAATGNSRLCFEGDVKVRDNTFSGDGTAHDVVLSVDNNAVINVTANGLDDGAEIGVYVTDGTNVFSKHGSDGQQFGTWAEGGAEGLDCFFNDRVDGLNGCSGGSNRICWGGYVCKITDAAGSTLRKPDGKAAVYQRLTQALDDFGLIAGAACVKMLVETYEVRQTTTISNFPAKDLTLTTARSDDAQHPYRGRPGTVCTISRSNSNNQLFKLDAAGATFRLTDVTLDGRRDKSADVGSYRLVEVGAGALVVGAGTTMQYGLSRAGGAIYSTGGTVTVNGSCDAGGNAAVRFVRCVASGTNKPDGNGGAINAVSLTVSDDGVPAGRHGTAFVDCHAKRGGAICANGADVSVDGASFEGCYSITEGGALYHVKTGTGTTAVSRCSFDGCYSGEGGSDWSYGGALMSCVSDLTVTDSSFHDCRALSDGGAVNHGARYDNIRQTTLSGCSFTGCRTNGTYGGYGFGGAVSTKAKAVDVTGCSFVACVSVNHGGALCCQSGVSSSRTTIGGDTSFEGCAAAGEGHGGGAVYSKSETLDVSSTTVTGCSAMGDGGAVASAGKTFDVGSTTVTSCVSRGDMGRSGALHMEKSGSTLNVGDGTRIAGCYAWRGGAVYLSRGVTMNVSGSPEFSRNGYAVIDGETRNADNGACLYLEADSRLNVSGAPAFSRNVITNVGLRGRERVANGGVLDYVRQDVYLAGYGDKNASSIHVTGEVTGDAIWVWPEESIHQHAGEQFAVTEAGVSEGSLDRFRNALPDGPAGTGCSNGEYLAGTRRPGDLGNAYWNKMYGISFRKMDNKGFEVADAEFTLYRDAACASAFATAVSADGETDTDERGDLLDKGTVRFAAVPIGVYYMRETHAPRGFKDNEVTYILLVGSPSLTPATSDPALWTGDGPLAVPNAGTLVDRNTMGAGRYYGLYPLAADAGGVPRADVSKNLASANVGIINRRDDYEAYFMKYDESGLALPGAQFTVFVQDTTADGRPVSYDDGYPVLRRWSRTGDEGDALAPVASADGSEGYRMADGTTVPSGMVYFRELPEGTYYLLETAYPTRNGRRRMAFYVESERVFRLDVKGEDGFELSERQADGSYSELGKVGGFYAVRNTEAVCKLTDAGGNLLFTRGHYSYEGGVSAVVDGVRTGLVPALCHTVEEGFDAAQGAPLVNASGSYVDPAAQIGIQVLKDVTVTMGIEHSATRDVVLTTAGRTRTALDKYVFSTTRTTDVSRALVTRGYDASGAGALVSVTGGGALTLKNVCLDGRGWVRSGRAVQVTRGALSVLSDTRIQNFRHVAADAGGDVAGGAVLMGPGTSLVVDGGEAYRSAVFAGNEASSGGSSAALGGAIALSDGCVASVSNARFQGNSAVSVGDGLAAGGAVFVSGPRLAVSGSVFQGNSSGGDGGALCGAAGSALSVDACSFSGNASGTQGDGAGGAIASDGTLSVSGSTIRDCSSPGDGGAIRSSGPLSVESTSFSGCSAVSGGAVSATGSAVISACSIMGCAASAAGGAVSLAGAEAEISGTSITWCSAVSGGAVWLGEGVSASFSGTIRNCNTSSSGSAIWVGYPSSSVHIAGDTIVAGNTAAGGGTIYVGGGAQAEIAGGEISGNTATGYGGGCLVDGGALTVSGGRISGNTATAGTAAIAYGGGIAIRSGSASVLGGEISGNSASGGAGSLGGNAYMASDSSMQVRGGIITSGSVSGDKAKALGAGIYVADGSSLSLSGNPFFGGAAIDSQTGNRVGWTVSGTNGGETYSVPRQDIYLSESGDPDTLTIDDALTCADGSIWIWAAGDPLHKSLSPFAKVSGTGASGNLSALRNARTDADSGNETGSWLHGEEGEDPALIYWNGVKGSALIVLRKVLEGSGGLSGAKMSVYKAGSDRVLEVDGTKLQSLTSDSTGVFWTGMLSYGTYHVHEEEVPSQAKQADGGWWYKLEVGEDGTSISAQSRTRPE